MKSSDLDSYRTNFKHGGGIKKDKIDKKPVLIAKGTIYVTEDVLEHLGCDLIRKINNASDDTPIIAHKFVQEMK